MITSFVDRKGFLERYFGSAVVDEEAKGFDILHYALREFLLNVQRFYEIFIEFNFFSASLRVSFTVLDIIYSEYALLYSCVDDKYTVIILSRNKDLNPQTVRRALKNMSKNSLSINSLNEIKQNCNFRSFV